jgi:hypothetical protein
VYRSSIIGLLQTPAYGSESSAGSNPLPKVAPVGQAEIPDLVSELTQHSGQLFLRGKHCMIRCNSGTHQFGSPSLRHTGFLNGHLISARTFPVQ